MEKQGQYMLLRHMDETESSLVVVDGTAVTIDQGEIVVLCSLGGALASGFVPDNKDSKETLSIKHALEQLN